MVRPPATSASGSLTYLLVGITQKRAPCYSVVIIIIVVVARSTPRRSSIAVAPRRSRGSTVVGRGASKHGPLVLQCLGQQRVAEGAEPCEAAHQHEGDLWAVHGGEPSADGWASYECGSDDGLLHAKQLGSVLWHLHRRCTRTATVAHVTRERGRHMCSTAHHSGTRVGNNSSRSTHLGGEVCHVRRAARHRRGTASAYQRAERQQRRQPTREPRPEAADP